MTAPEPEVIACRDCGFPAPDLTAAERADRLHHYHANCKTYLKDALANALAAKSAAEAQRDEANNKLWAITDIKLFPTREQLQACVERLKPRDRDIIDRAFAEGATLLVAAKYEMDKAERERVAARAMLTKTVDALESVAVIFDGYARLHAAKMTPEGDTKAEANLKLAVTIREAIDAARAALPTPTPQPEASEG